MQSCPGRGGSPGRGSLRATPGINGPANNVRRRVSTGRGVCTACVYAGTLATSSRTLLGHAPRQIAD
eukprot:3938106-Rhodomonas_salina.9